MDASIENLLVTDEMIQHRLDRLLTLQYPAYSRTYFQYLIEAGFVLVNGHASEEKR